MDYSENEKAKMREMITLKRRAKKNNQKSYL